jgi:tRNA/rRNA methyltransferase
VNPYDPSFREARSAVGAADVLRNAQEYTSVPDAVSDCALVVGTTAGRNRQPQQPLRPLPVAARLLRKHLGRGPVALLFGSEKRGLSNDDLSHCHWLLRIPTRQDHPSINLGQAVAVCLYELRRGAVRERNDEPASAAGAQVDRMGELLFQALAACGYVKPRAGAATQERLRLLLRRMNLMADDAETWTGMLRKIAGQLERQKR